MERKMTDLISRAEALDVIKTLCESIANEAKDAEDSMICPDKHVFALREQIKGMTYAINVLKVLPSVSAERVGEWIENTGRGAYCSVCGSYPYARESNWNYCPNCGARMESEWVSMNLKCPNCGFAFRLDTRTTDEEELKELMTCPCGALMEITDELEPTVMKGGTSD